MKIEPEQVTRLIAVQLGCAEIGAEDRLVEDLAASSVDLVNLAVALEDRFGIDISETEMTLARTVADVCELIDRLSAARGP